MLVVLALLPMALHVPGGPVGPARGTARAVTSSAVVPGMQLDEDHVGILSAVATPHQVQQLVLGQDPAAVEHARVAHGRLPGRVFGVDRF